MNKWTVVILVLFAHHTGFSLPVGNPKEADLLLNGLYCPPTPRCCDFCNTAFLSPKTWSVRLGYYGDFVFDRSLKASHATETEEIRRTLKKAQIFTQAGYLVWNFCNRIDLFGTLGVTTMHFCQDARIFGSPVSFNSDLEFSNAFSWSVGGRMTLWEIGRIAMGIEGQYLRAHPAVERFVSHDSDTAVDFDHLEGHYDEWQIGLGLSYHLPFTCSFFGFIPYGAIKYSDVHLSFNNFQFSTIVSGLPSLLTLTNLHSRKPWGCCLGVSITVSCVSAITVEADFGDEKALYLNGQIRF